MPIISMAFGFLSINVGRDFSLRSPTIKSIIYDIGFRIDGLRGKVNTFRHEHHGRVDNYRNPSKNVIRLLGLHRQAGKMR